MRNPIKLYFFRGCKRAIRISLRLGCAAMWMIPAAPATSATEAQTLCRGDELTVFSCPTGAHIASICASKDISSNKGYMQYRFGQRGSTELEYPQLGKKPANAFMSGVMIYSGGGGAFLRFHRKAFNYTIFSAIGKWGPSGEAANAAGVVVRKNGKSIANYPCSAKAVGVLGPDFADKLGLKMVDPAEDFEIPQVFLPK